jgi:hypothetical protein
MSLIRTGRRALLLTAPLAVAGVVLLSACSSAASGTESSTGSSADSTQSSTSGDAGGAAAPGGDMQAFVSCLAENGVTLPNAGTGGGSAGDGARPSGRPRPDGATHAPGTPPAGGSGAAGATPPPPQGVDPEAWDAAMQACGNLVPANFGKGRGTPGV